MGYLWNFKIKCKYIEPLIKSLFATTVANTKYHRNERIRGPALFTIGTHVAKYVWEGR
jgi:hypothetical protein